MATKQLGEHRLSLGAAQVLIQKAVNEIQKIDLRTVEPNVRAEIRKIREEASSHAKQIELILRNDRKA